MPAYLARLPPAAFVSEWKLSCMTARRRPFEWLLFAVMLALMPANLRR